MLWAAGLETTANLPSSRLSARAALPWAAAGRDNGWPAQTRAESAHKPTHRPPRLEVSQPRIAGGKVARRGDTYVKRSLRRVSHWRATAMLACPHRISEEIVCT